MISASWPLEAAGMPQLQSLRDPTHEKGEKGRVKWQFNPPGVLSHRCFADCALFGNFEIGPGFHVQDKV